MTTVFTTINAQQRAISDIRAERIRQEELKEAGRFSFTCADNGMADSEKLAVLMEEIGEATNAYQMLMLTDLVKMAGNVSRAILEESNLANDKHGAELRKELVQVGAVVLAWLESLP